MKYGFAITTSLVSAGALFLACSAEDPAPPPVAGLAGATSTPGAGGAPPVGAAGSAPATTAGTGPTSSGGATSEGQGGAPTLQAGAGTGPVGGGDPAAGGAPAAAGGAPAGGAGGAPGTELTLQELVGPMDGHLFIVPCSPTQSDDCLGAGWTSTFLDPGMFHQCVGVAPQSRLEARIDFPVGGEPGVAYDVDMHFYGIMEPRVYANVTRDAAPGAPSPDERGTPTPFATLNPGATNYLAGDNNYNTYELRVLNQNGEEVSAHFLNADVRDGHFTLAINYEKTLRLIGGGALRLQIVDANCRQIKNCTTPGRPCAPKARTIDISAADPQPAANALQQPALGVSPEDAGQWFLLDVLDFAVAE